MEEEAYAQIVWGGEGGGSGGGEELECHGGGVVGYAIEIWVCGREVCETEEGLETTVGAELDVDTVCHGAFLVLGFSFGWEDGVPYGVFPASVTVALRACTI